MTPTGSRSKAQGCPRYVRETLDGCKGSLLSYSGVWRSTLKGLRTALCNPFRVASFPVSTRGFPQKTRATPGFATQRLRR